MEWERLGAQALSRPDRLVMDIERLITSGALPPGSRVPPERELAVMLKVSRTSVRDALRDLGRRGLVDRRPGRGTIILDPGASGHGDSLVHGLTSEGAELVELMEVRACIEPSIAARAAAHATPRDIAALARTLEEQEASSAPAAFRDLDRAFHRSIALYTGNPLLARLADTVQELTEPSRGLALQTAARRRTSLAEHRLILQAIASHDSAAAMAAALDHVTSVERHLVASASAP